MSFPLSLNFYWLNERFEHAHFKTGHRYSVKYYLLFFIYIKHECYT